VLASWANAAGDNKKCTIKNLITYKRALTDRHSRNLELWSHPLAATYMNQAESSGPLHRGASQVGEILWRSLVVWIFCSMKSTTGKLCELTFHVWYHLMAYWCLADWMIAASHSSSNMVKSWTLGSFDRSSLKCCTQKDLCSTSVVTLPQTHKPEKMVCVL
jgi:hypothetical protein